MGGSALYINLFDSHVHSDNSFDAAHSLTFLCEKAVEQGVIGIAVTDHCELRDYHRDHYAQRLAQAAFDVRKCRAVFRGQLSLLFGVELSDLFYDEALAARVLQQFPFDLVLVSQHTDQDGVDCYYVDYHTKTRAEIDAYLRFYFEYLLRVARQGDFDALAHLTYPLRYIQGTHKIPVDLGRYEELIDEILRQLAARGKALEVNTSGLAGELGDTMPPARYLKRFRQLGGEYVTLGSDAHAAERVGAGLQQAMQLLADAGFSYFTVYKGRQPLQLKLI